MVSLGQWFLLEPIWLVGFASIAGILVGIGLRKLLKREKIMAIFIPLIIFLFAEYMASGSGTGNPLWTILGGLSAMVFLGVALPSALMPWFRHR